MCRLHKSVPDNIFSAFSKSLIQTALQDLTQVLSKALWGSPFQVHQCKVSTSSVTCPLSAQEFSRKWKGHLPLVKPKYIYIYMIYIYMCLYIYLLIIIIIIYIWVNYNISLTWIKAFLPLDFSDPFPAKAQEGTHPCPTLKHAPSHLERGSDERKNWPELLGHFGMIPRILTMIIVRSQWGRYNLPILYIYDPGLPSPPLPPWSPPVAWDGGMILLVPPPCGLGWWYGSSGPPPVACGGGMLVCWYVGMLVCWYVCMYVCMHLCIYASMHLCIYVCM